jgi:hypothetical protein
VESGPDADTPRPVGVGLLLCMLERGGDQVAQALLELTGQLQVGRVCEFERKQGLGFSGMGGLGNTGFSKGVACTGTAGVDWAAAGGQGFVLSMLLGVLAWRLG